MTQFATAETLVERVRAPLSLVLGTFILLCVVADVRMLRAGGVRGTARLSRHLQRMCVTLFIAAGSFFLGQAQVMPEALRSIPLLAVLSVAPLVAMGYWVWRIRTKGTRGISLADSRKVRGSAEH